MDQFGMGLREPVFSFTIPSIHDDMVLDCRIYHPVHFLHDGHEALSAWGKKGAIIAHPYAPFGGSYDDPVVEAVATEILKQGFVVGLFNFRGAGTSNGKTSWTAKPELADYISFAGFFVHYLHGLEPPISTSSPPPTRALSDHTLTPIQSTLTVPRSPSDLSQDTSMILILGGYSYGSLIASHLPPTKTILERFADAAVGTAEAEICLRAQHLSQQWNKETQRDSIHRCGRSSHDRDIKNPSISVAFGGEETEPGSRRPSRESRRSVDRVRKSFDEARKHLSHHKRHSSEEEAAAIDPTLKAVNIPLPDTHYLLISPLLPPTSTLLTCFSNIGAIEKWKHHGSQSASGELNTSCESSLVSNPTMAIYGDHDVFISHRKLRKWAEGLVNKPGSRFQFHEIAGAGHFWHENGVEIQLRGFLKAWVQDLARGGGNKPRI
ncbi:MAG: hypothetical protein M1812_006771 [Candelaria pacifica]|nr:MAG: hypothetical protein M1812_006771 [Candelaria pacifica]